MKMISGSREQAEEERREQRRMLAARSSNYPDKYWDAIERVDPTVAAEVTFDWLHPASGELVLDIGCGTGRFMVLVEKSGAQTIGLEPTRVPLERARWKTAGTLIVASGEYLPFADESFDKILCNHVIEHLVDPELALREMHRSLKNGGRLVLSFPNSNYLPFLLRLVRQDPTHLARFSSLFRPPPRFKSLQKRVFLSIPRSGDRLLEKFRVSRLPLVREVFYNVVLLLQKNEDRPTQAESHRHETNKRILKPSS